MEDAATQIDIFLRGAAVASLTLCAVIFLGSPGSRPGRLPMLSLCTALTAYLLVSSPALALQATAVGAALIWLAGAVPILAFWVGVEIFLDRFVWRPWHLVAAGLALGTIWLTQFLPWLAPVRGGIAVLLYGGLLAVALVTASGDLVGARRTFRRVFVVVLALGGLLVSVIEILGLDSDLPGLAHAALALAFVVLTGLFVVWSTRLASDLHPTTRGQRQLPKTDLSDAEASVLRRVRQAMDDGIWRREALSISQLAQEVKAPDHRVRRAINAGLGYRNFSHFVNARRIDAARAALADPMRADVPVLTIAFDVGFGSVGPFNRAFREATGQSPTEFRKERLRDATADPQPME